MAFHIQKMTIPHNIGRTYPRTIFHKLACLA